MRLKRCSVAPVLMAAWWSVMPAAAAGPEVRIGSKGFTESVILGEIAAHLVESAGGRPLHRRELGGTRVLWNALLRGDIDVYPEYSGTISQEIFAGRGVRGDDAVRNALEALSIQISRPFGFNNTYAIGMRADVADRLGIGKISDLIRHPGLEFGFSNEFMDRGDGWPSLRQLYGLPQLEVHGLDHDLAYRGLESGSIHATDLYSTDAEIRYYDLRVLEDDRGHFPAYNGALLYRTDLQERAPGVVDALLKMEGRISAVAMVEMNARAKLEKVPRTGWRPIS